MLEFGCSFTAPRLETCAALSYELLQDVIAELVNVSESFAAQVAPADLEALPVFVVHSVYKAARLLLGLIRDSPKVDSRRAVSVLERVLQCMGTRWMAGSMSYNLRYNLGMANWTPGRYLDDLKGIDRRELNSHRYFLV